MHEFPGEGGELAKSCGFLQKAAFWVLSVSFEKDTEFGNSSSKSVAMLWEDNVLTSRALRDNSDVSAAKMFQNKMTGHIYNLCSLSPTRAGQFFGAHWNPF